ncbi:Methyltransferase domain-containing protein [Actinopolymorpha cephalotaxi]|uniref:Methyltransferase domain-containing protein n=1 Tax=Actinopolymorpha cephalotaxi TaxID=504797 RepID=A0A1I3BEY2_9ACTN|nr:class I SAM-dependent methyltransferase [Actinopolymorpha cephalotaxi]NYH86353.1 SAM-dependent methyltransferase [Actinopolymorpha cephalotaxi]SFH60875.1 Methyltransferase domain-containing protein [Actinopolymorpha cephalotaxi]
MTYYHAEHEAAYEQIAQRGLTKWDDLFEDGRPNRYEEFPNRRFLERTLARLDLPAPDEVDVLEYGCGTGPAACFLASLGFRVRAVDLIPRAIALAREFARQRGLDITFDVQDMCALAHVPATRRYDLVVDSFCLQSIVTDADRADLFAAVRARLAPGGHYLISTAMYEPERDYEGSRYDEATGVCHEEVPAEVVGAVRIDDRWYRPHRRHLRPEAFRAELIHAGFDILSQDTPSGGDVVCTLSTRS